MRSDDSVSTGFGSVRLNWSRLLGCGLALLLACPALFSQGSTGRILGGVTSYSGGHGSRSRITIPELHGGITRKLVTYQADASAATGMTACGSPPRVDMNRFQVFARQNVL